MRLINADKGLISKIQRETGCNFITAQKIVDSMPTVEERKVGKWKSDGHGHIVCTACNEVNVTIWKSKYCPCCGAKMRGAENGN